MTGTVQVEGVQTNGTVSVMVQSASAVSVGSQVAATPVAWDPTRLNVVVIVVDDAGREEMPWYELGSDYAHMPRLDGFRAKGVTFRNAYSCPICGPTRACILCGIYGKGTGFAANIINTVTGFRVPDSLVFIPEMIMDGRTAALYARGAFGKWHLCSFSGQDSHPFDNGFARYFGCISNAAGNPEGTSFNGSGHFRWRKVTGATTYSYVPSSYDPLTAPPFPDGGVYDDTCFDAAVNVRDALSWINTRTGPFFCYLPINVPHSPYERSPDTFLDNTGTGATGLVLDMIHADTKTALDAASIDVGEDVGADAVKRRLVFKGNLEYLDSLVGLLYDRMEPTRRANTVFIVWGDNGTVAQQIQPPYDPLHAKRFLYEQGIWVGGMIFSDNPVIVSPGRWYDGLAHAVDIARTVGDLCGVDWSRLDETVARDSVSLLPVLQNDPDGSGRTRVYVELFDPLGGPPNPETWQAALLDGTYKVIRKPDATYEFYRITAAAAWSSGQPGYLELAEDNYWPALTSHSSEVQSAFATLAAELDATMAEA